MGRFTFGTSKFAQATGSRHVTECVGEAFELLVLPSPCSAGLIIMNRHLHTILSDIVERIANIAETAILQEGGKKMERDGQIVYVIPRK
jgi:hypothetical protein